MSQRLNNKVRGFLSGALLLGTLAGCSGVGGNTGIDYAPAPFLDEGGIGIGVGDTLPGQYLAGRQALREQDADAAYKFFDKAYNLENDDNFLLENAFQAALSKGDTPTALKLAIELLKREPDGNDTAQLVLGIDAISRSDFEQAKIRMRSIATQGINILLKPVLTAWIHVAEGDANAAIAELDALDKYEGFKLLKSYHLALIADALARDDLAAEQYGAALKGPSGQAVRLVQAYGVFLLRQGRKDAVEQLFQDYKKRFPLSPTINKLIDQLDQDGTIDALITNPIEGAAEALYSSAAIIGQERANQTAITLAYFALMLRPDLDVADVLLAEIAEERGQLEKARSYYQKVPETSPYSLNSRIRVAWLTYKLGEEEAALDTLEDITRENPGEAEPLIVMADLNRDRKDWEAAAEAYGAAIDNIGDVKSRLWSLLYARGIAYERMNKWKLAEADLQAALDLQPNHPQILNYLGYSWVDRGEKLDEAKALLIKAVSLRPRDGYIVDSLGWMYYRLKDYKNAALQLEKAVTLQPEDPTINDHLGDVYWRVGRESEARYQWQRALWLEPDAEQIPIIQEKLKSGLPAAKASEK